MKVKMLIEPKERAREEIKLQTAMPSDAESLKRWMESWISKKDLKQWNKSDWPADTLGEKRPGKVLRAVWESSSGEKPLGGSYMALRSYVPDNAGGRKRLPLVLFGKLSNRPCIPRSLIWPSNTQGESSKENRQTRAGPPLPKPSSSEAREFA